MKIYKYTLKDKIYYSTIELLKIKFGEEMFLKTDYKVINKEEVILKSYCVSNFKHQNEYFKLTELELDDVDLSKVLVENKGVFNRSDNLNIAEKNTYMYLKSIGILEKKIFYFSDFLSAFPSVQFELINNKKTYYGYGRANSYSNAKKIALLELTERFVTSNFNYKNNSVYSSYKKLKKSNNVINPIDLILPKNTNYTENKNYSWIKCFSIINRNQIYIPTKELYYFYKEKDDKHENELLYSTSNGCSLANSYSEAILYGCLEVIERHNFLNFWYNKEKPKKIDILKLKTISESLKKEILNIQKKKNVKTSFYLLMSKYKKTYTILAISFGKNVGQNHYCATSTSFDMSEAISIAFKESVVGISLYKTWNQNQSKENSVNQHIFWHLNNESKWINEIEKQEYNNDIKIYEILDIPSKLKYLIEITKLENKDMIVCNMTSKLMKYYNVYAVKVIIPNYLPMTFGISNERVKSKKNFEIHPFP